MTTQVDDLMTISEAAGASGLSADTLRYYEKAGLIPNRPERSSSGQRRYSDADLRWIGTLVMLRRTGMGISEVRRFVELYRVEDSEAERLAILREHRDRVLVQLEETQQHLAAIDRKIDYYEKGMTR